MTIWNDTSGQSTTWTDLEDAAEVRWVVFDGVWQDQGEWFDSLTWQDTGDWTSAATQSTTWSEQ